MAHVHTFASKGSVSKCLTRGAGRVCTVLLHANTDGTVSLFRRRVFSFILQLPCRAPVEKYAAMKCAPQTTVDEVTLKCCPTSRLIAQASVSSSLCSQEVHEMRDQDTCHVNYCSLTHKSGHALTFCSPGRLDPYLFTYCHSYHCPFSARHFIMQSVYCGEYRTRTVLVGLLLCIHY